MQSNQKKERIYNILWSFYCDGTEYLHTFLTKATPLTLSLKKHRLLLVYGYIHQYSCEYHVYIPMDLISNILVHFYDNSIIWNICGDEMRTFKSSNYKNTIYGPRFEVIDGMEFEVTVCPKGWKVNGNVQCYLELRNFPSEYIKEITLTFTLFVRETEYEYKKTVIYHKNGKRKAHGWSQHAMKFVEIQNQNYTQLHIGCSVDIIHIRFVNPCQYQNIVTRIPKIAGVQKLVWRVDNAILNKMRNLNKSISFTKTYKRNIHWILQFALHGDNVWFYVKLLCLPFHIRAIQIKYELIVLLPGNEQYLYDSHGKYWLALNMDADRYKKGCKLFKPKRLKTIYNQLTFKLKIYVTDYQTVKQTDTSDR